MTSQEEEIQNIPLSQRGDEWKDLTPLPPYDSKIEVFNIDYSPKYIELAGYLRALLAKGEKSLRGYKLTTELIEYNATCYSAWTYRRQCIDALNLSLEDEIKWVDGIIVENQKNYQIWYHRKVIVDKFNDCKFEKPALEEVFKDDAKNFHAWCHRIWMIRRFHNLEGEFEFIEKLLDYDIKNNSVWNYRFFLVNYTKIEEGKSEEKEKVIADEINYALEKIKKVPNNESAYSYLRGYITKFNKKYSDYKGIKETLLEINKNGSVNHAWSMLLDIYEEEKDKKLANEAIEELITLDYIRRKYWGWRKENFNF